MEIKHIAFENFRPFYGTVNVDLTINNNQNIVLIGGKNGHGKTNFLLGVVWCLYGELIGKVDDSFKAEVANNSSQFLNSILNRDKALEGEKNFSVEVVFSNVSYGDNTQKSTIKIKRSYNVEEQKEWLDVESYDDELFMESTTKKEKQDFINDYLVPIEIARFVFFDAEKISQIADLTTQKQAKLMNQIFGNMLGLNVYQNLLDEIEAHIRKLKKESSTDEIKEQIIIFENSIKYNQQKIDVHNIKREELNKKNKEAGNKIEQLEVQISRKGGDNTDITTLHSQRDELQKQRDELQKKFSDMADIIPLFILSGLMQETKEHVEIEKNNQDNELSKEGFSEKMDLLIEELFNKGERPNPDILLKQKIFYEEKSKTLVCLIEDDKGYIELGFEHNLDLSKIKDLEEKYKNIQSQSDTDFSHIITGFSKKKNELSALEKKIKQLELASADDLTRSLIDDKNDLQKDKDELNKQIGGIEANIAKLESDNSASEKKRSFLLDKSKVNEKNQKKIQLSNKYIEVLKGFIKEEKEEKTEAIKNKLLQELESLWHKKLINRADLTILPNDKGMDVELFDENDKPINSKDLSKGEQQIYVSALLKAILDSSIHNLPVFIDTPLARLDSEHRDNILQHYYPNLSTQVVVFSTDTEITVEKYAEINKYIASSYLIENIDGKSNINEGYFN